MHRFSKKLLYTAAALVLALQVSPSSQVLGGPLLSKPSTEESPASAVARRQILPPRDIEDTSVLPPGIILLWNMMQGTFKNLFNPTPPQSYSSGVLLRLDFKEEVPAPGHTTKPDNNTGDFY